MLWLVLSAVLGLSSSQLCTDNVRSFCGGSITPTACMNDRCSALATSEFDDNFKRQIVDAHNKYRREPFAGQYASNMLEVTWDDGLARNALNWAHQLCIVNDVFGPGHDRCRVTPSYNSVGQNMAWGAGGPWRSTSELGSKAVEMWYAEYKLASSGDLFPFNGGKSAIGHYTQLVWARSYKIGCAYVVQSMPVYDKQAWIICNYAKAGNYIGQNVFERGVQGSNCPAGSQRNPNGLCRVTDENRLRDALGVQRT